MNEPETGEAPEAARGNTDLQKELAEVLRQRAAKKRTCADHFANVRK
jgi:hypothetical protein